MKNINCCIGIISYFPDDEAVRVARINHCQELLNNLSTIFKDIPIVIVAQNWFCNDIQVNSNNITLLQFNKLGILSARKVLRKYFLENTNYDYIILFDDDCVLNGTETDGNLFLRALAENPDKYYYARKNMFKLCAISRKIFSDVPLPDIGVDDESGLEDLAYAAILDYSYKNSMISDIDCRLSETSDWATNPLESTWPRKNIYKLIQKTKEYLDSIGVST